MLFNSFAFLVFLPVVFLVYWFATARKTSAQNAWLLLASYFFYGWWNWRFVFLLLLSTLIDYGFGIIVSKANNKKRYLWLSILNNLLVLGIFKYYNFFVKEAAELLSHAGILFSPLLLKILLPVGISFYTFHGMSYVFDIYRNRCKPVYNFIEYALFVSFFPLLVAGPIERANHLLPQIQKTRVFNYQQAVTGVQLVVWGLFKKVVIADSLAPVVNNIFDHYTNYSGLVLAAGAVFFALQIYGDFSGYSDIAIGVAMLFGFELLSNFRSPYFSRDVAEFWRRWHISLSSWFRDYLYIPLGGSKNGKWRAVINTFIIFLVSGFWHGANWTFIVWGAIHALLFIPLLLAQQNRRYSNEVVAYNRWYPTVKETGEMLLTFSLVSIAWIFFRSPDLGSALGYLQKMFSFSNHAFPRNLGVGTASALVTVFLLLEWTQRKNERKIRLPRNLVLRNITYLFFIYFTWKYAITAAPSEFIYFQF